MNFVVCFFFFLIEGKESLDLQHVNEEFIFYTEQPGNEKLISAISILSPPPGSQATLASLCLPIFRVGRNTDVINLRNDTLMIILCVYLPVHCPTYPPTLPPLECPTVINCIIRCVYSAN